MSGMLICEYQLEQRKALGILPDNGALVTTIVSSNMAQAAAKSYGVKFIECLTGFKYIGEQIKFFEQNHSYQYLFGFEESYGCLVGTHARDKDAVVAVMALCEAAAYYKTQGITLWDKMIQIYEKYGYYREDQVSKTFKGADGAKKMQDMMDAYRKDTPTQIGAYKVLKFRDYKNDVIVDMKTKETTATGLPKSNVLYFDLEDDAWFCVRPSGTEPKIKFYAGVKGTSLEDSIEKLQALLDTVRD
jgi:phosphoglucomutase